MIAEVLLQGRLELAGVLVRRLEEKEPFSPR
jgi:hypothetical protein